MKSQFRDHFIDYVESSLKSDFDRLSDAQRSLYMARFYADRIVRPTNPALIPEVEEDLDACMVDGANDCGVDFISRAGNTVLIIQAKYTGSKKSSRRPHEDPADFDSFAGVLGRIYATSSQTNAKLSEAIIDIDWDKDQFDLRYITLRKPASNSVNIQSEGVDLLQDLPDIRERSSIEILGETALNAELRDALKIVQGAPSKVSLLFTPDSEGQYFLSVNHARRSLIGRISGSQLAEVYREHKSRLFALNLRNYVGDNATNRGIRSSAINDPQDFFFFNNGISALATQFSSNPDDPRRIDCSDFSIINGAQTVRSLAKAQDNNRDALRDVQVLIRITEVSSKRTAKEQSFLDTVTKFNNTQNAIKISDFRSNDSIQQDLSQKFAGLKARDGKRFHYKNKRTAENERTKIPIGMEEFTKTVFSFKFGPADMYGGTSFLFDSSKDGGYYRLFGDGAGEIKPRLTSQEFSSLVVCVTRFEPYPEPCGRA